jgi:hypothetical protein
VARLVLFARSSFLEFIVGYRRLNYLRESV